MNRSSVLLLILAGCASTDRHVDSTGKVAPYYSEAHIDFAGWNRTPECCVAKGKKIALASGGTHSTQAGITVSEQGGNVVDAAVAAALAMSVERPFSTGIGGGGFLLARLDAANGPRETFLDFRESAPRKATATMFLDEKGEVIAGKSASGVFAVGTPGLVAGLYEAHRKWGKLPWKKVVQPSIDLAEKGFPVYKSLAGRIEGRAEHIKKDPYLAKLLFKADGKPLARGDTLRQPELAETLRAIAKGGAKAFYTGATAKKIARFVRAKGGLLDEKDLADYRVKSREPITGTFKGHKFLAAPPPSGGGVVLAQVLQVLEPYDLATEATRPVEYAHLLSQAMKRAFADRSAYVADPDSVKLPYAQVATAAYAEAARAKLDRAKNTPSSEISAGEFLKKPGGTAHVSAIDERGNAVGITVSINGPWGANIVAPGTGVILNNTMDDFAVKPGAKTVSLSGLTGGDVNAVGPNKRPASSMTPVIVLDGDRPALVLGGAGGSLIVSGALEIVANWASLYPGDVRRAVFAPRVHHQWMPDRFDLEKGYPEPIRDGLKRKGHELGDFRWPSIFEVVARDADGTVTAVNDPRDEGGAAAR